MFTTTSALILPRKNPHPVSPSIGLNTPRLPTLLANECPFVLDFSISRHISPVRSNFVTFTVIPAYTVKGFGGSCAYAFGWDDTNLCIPSGQPITLKYALFIPAPSIPLVCPLRTSWPFRMQFWRRMLHHGCCRFCRAPRNSLGGSEYLHSEDRRPLILSCQILSTYSALHHSHHLCARY